MAPARTYAALLRGINVGGANPIPMAALRELVASLGHEDVVSYLQSGNIVFSTRTAHPDRIARELEQALTRTFGHAVTVLVRTGAELAAVVAANPFPGREADGTKVHVVFLDTPPTAAAIAKLDPERSPGDSFQVAAREIYLDLPNGSGRTKLTLDYFEKRLGVTGTARNWNTLVKLVELTAG